eukprot:Opistho-2@9291
MSDESEGYNGPPYKIPWTLDELYAHYPGKDVRVEQALNIVQLVIGDKDAKHNSLRLEAMELMFEALLDWYPPSFRIEAETLLNAFAEIVWSVKPADHKLLAKRLKQLSKIRSAEESKEEIRDWERLLTEEYFKGKRVGLVDIYSACCPFAYIFLRGRNQSLDDERDPYPEYTPPIKTEPQTETATHLRRPAPQPPPSKPAATKPAVKPISRSTPATAATTTHSDVTTTKGKKHALVDTSDTPAALQSPAKRAKTVTGAAPASTHAISSMQPGGTSVTNDGLDESSWKEPDSVHNNNNDDWGDSGHMDHPNDGHDHQQHEAKELNTHDKVAGKAVASDTYRAVEDKERFRPSGSDMAEGAGRQRGGHAWTHSTCSPTWSCIVAVAIFSLSQQ